MNQLTDLFEEFIMKAIVQSEAMLTAKLDLETNDLETFTGNRDRLLSIINQISTQIDWTLVSLEKRDEFNRQFDYIKKLDEKILTKLLEFREELKQDIDRTHRQNVSIKGYNLNDVK